jgi:phage terminase large subunit-like protein
MLLEVRRLLSLDRLAQYDPYEKQAQFHAAGAKARERLFMAGNQLGKTVAGGFEAAMHATGLYPDWWVGRRFDKPTVGWAAGVTGETTRDNPQRVLLGRSTAHGTGAIPAKRLVQVVPGRGVPELVNTIKVKHLSGGTSHIVLKAYEQGREKWQGDSVDWVWFDEEPPQDIYSEGLTRTNATNGIAFMTFTPLLGMSEVVRSFLHAPTPDRHVTTMTIDDAPHYSPEQRARIIASYPAHEREARAKGIPVLGSGRIFPIEEALIEDAEVQLPAHWPRICGLDIGYDHPTAAAWLAWDRDADVIHVYDVYRLREQTPVVHSAAIRARGVWIPVAWPHDALQHDKGGSGEQIAEQYRKHGINMLPDRATFADGSSGVEAGLMEMLDRMKTGRLKVAKHLEDWWQEFRLYHRKDGRVVKEIDDLMSATRYAMMMLREAKTPPSGMGGKINYPKRRYA